MSAPASRPAARPPKVVSARYRRPVGPTGARETHGASPTAAEFAGFLADTLGRHGRELVVREGGLDVTDEAGRNRVMVCAADGGGVFCDVWGFTAAELRAGFDAPRAAPGRDAAA